MTSQIQAPQMTPLKPLLNLRQLTKGSGGIMPEKQKPTVGRVVHYQAYGTPGGEYKSAPRAAIVTQVLENDEVGLAIMNPTGMFFNPAIQYSEEPKPGCWNWPPRV